MSLDQAMSETAAARDRLTGIYGRVPAVVLFTQREPDGPVRIGRALRLAGRVAELHREAPGPVIVAAVVPGGQALERWFALRLMGAGPRHAIVFARNAGARHEHHWEATGDPARAMTAAVRDLDPFLAGVERLYLDGARYVDLMAATGLTLPQTQKTVERMRSLGFDLPHRINYGRRRTAA